MKLNRQPVTRRSGIRRAFAWLALASTSALAGEPQRVEVEPLAAPLTLGAVMRAAVAHNPGVAAREKDAEIAEVEQRGMAAHFGPVIRAEVNAMIWNSDNRYAFDMSAFGTLFGQLGAPAGLIVPPMSVMVREQVTAKTTIMAVQPLLQLWQMSLGLEAKKHMAESARFDAVTARRELELHVARAYFGHLSALEMRSTLADAERSLAAYEKQTRDYVKAGLLDRESLLKVLVQKEELAKSRRAVETAIKLSRAQLNMLMAKPLDAELALACAACGETSAGQVGDLITLQEQAMLLRPELRSGRAQRNAAAAGLRASRGKWLPDLNAIAAYNRNTGMGDLMLRDEAFVGLSLNWNVWDWGATRAEGDAAALRQSQADLMVQSAEEGLRLQVEERLLEVDEAKEQHAVAEAALALAAEALRLEENRFAVHETEAAELIRTQLAAVKARHDVTLATMQIELAKRALVLATGHDLLDTLDNATQENAK